MTTQVEVPLRLSDPARCRDALHELFSAVGVVSHPKVRSVSCQPGDGPFRQQLILEMLETESSHAARAITDAVLTRVLNRINGGVSAQRYTIAGAAL